MNDRAVIDIIKRIFIFKGYSVASSGFSDLVAEINDEKLFIKYEPSTNINSVRYFGVNLKKNGGKGILISDSFDERTQMFAYNEGITLWDRKELESWVGAAVLSGALSANTEPESHIEETSGEDIFSAFQAPVKNKLLTPEPMKEEYEKTIRLSLASVPINIGKSDASFIAKEKISTIKSQKLKFVPVWYYRYSFSTQKRYKSKTIDLSGRGEGCIDGLTSGHSGKRYNDIMDNTFVPTMNYEIVKPAVEKKDASAKALEAIIRDNTREERINEMIGDTIVFQQKVFAPDPQAVTLEMELIHIPVWEIEGDNKILEINAHDGHIIAKSREKHVGLAGKGHIIDGDKRVPRTKSKSRITYDDAEFV